MNYLIDFSGAEARNEFELVIRNWEDWDVCIIRNSSHFLLRTSGSNSDIRLYQLLLAHGFFTEVDKS